MNTASLNYAPTKGWVCSSLKGVPLHCIIFRTATDPACGSGNFLTETYLSLRRLENEVIREKVGGQMTLGEAHNPIRVSIQQFYGIEINDFAVTVAKTALWIAESQMMEETKNIVHPAAPTIPVQKDLQYDRVWYSSSYLIQRIRQADYRSITQYPLAQW